MSKNTSISLGDYFEQFVISQVSVGRYKNISEVIRAGLRLLENEEDYQKALKRLEVIFDAPTETGEGDEV